MRKHADGYFTVASANKAIPHVQQKFREVAGARSSVSAAEKRLEAAVMAGASLAEYARQKRELNLALSAYYAALEALESTGVIVKSVEHGLMDFPSRRFDEDVWLCWKHDEDEVKFWHEKDGGFQNRKPLEVSDESLV